jgi:hypothetical protein
VDPIRLGGFTGGKKGTVVVSPACKGPHERAYEGKGSKGEVKTLKVTKMGNSRCKQNTTLHTLDGRGESQNGSLG